MCDLQLYELIVDNNQVTKGPMDLVNWEIVIQVMNCCPFCANLKRVIIVWTWRKTKVLLDAQYKYFYQKNIFENIFKISAEHFVEASVCWGSWKCGFKTRSRASGPWFSIKMSSYQYRKSHCGDKTVVRSSYLHNGSPYTGKMTSLYWFSPLLTKRTDFLR